jgi:hypothetical protein
LVAHTAGISAAMHALSAAVSTQPEDGELNMPSAMSVRSAM